MLPAKIDPRWKMIAQDPEKYKAVVTGFPVKMLLSGLKIRGMTNSIDELIDETYAFFVKNEKVVTADIKALFG